MRAVLGNMHTPQGAVARGAVHLAVGAPARLYHLLCVPDAVKGPGPLIRGRSVSEASYRYAQQMLQVL